MLHKLEDHFFDIIKKPNIVRLLFVVAIYLVGHLGYYFVGASVYNNTTKVFCDLVESYFVNPNIDEKVKLLRECKRQFESDIQTKSEWIKRATPLLKSQTVSHFYILNPSDYKEAFGGEVLSNGFNLIALDGRFFVFSVDGKGVASKQGIKFGDQLLSINESPNFNQYEMDQAGIYEFSRNEVIFRVKLEPKVFEVSKAPSKCVSQSRVGYLKVSSFTEGAFDRNLLKSLMEDCMAVDSLIVDLRGNRGGDIENMILLAELLDCDSKNFGTFNPSKIKGSTGFFGKQVDQLIGSLKKNKKLVLNRVSNPKCFSKQISVLIDGETGSAAEILASHLRGARKAKILGQTSSGEVVLSGIFELSGLLQGSFLSMPVGLYDGPEGAIEGYGIVPDEFLFYKSSDLKLGIDSWMKYLQVPGPF